MSKRYEYFISYFSTDKNSMLQQISNCQLTRNKKINEYSDICEIGKTIEKKLNRKDVVVLNFILLNSKEVKDEQRR